MSLSASITPINGAVFTNGCSTVSNALTISAIDFRKTGATTSLASFQSPYRDRVSGLLQIAVSTVLRTNDIAPRQPLPAQHCRYGTTDVLRQFSREPQQLVPKRKAVEEGQHRFVQLFLLSRGKWCSRRVDAVPVCPSLANAQLKTLLLVKRTV
jgi:hypothetical protein